MLMYTTVMFGLINMFCVYIALVFPVYSLLSLSLINIVLKCRYKPM